MAERNRAALPTFYDSWMAAQGIPLHRAYGIADIRDVERAHWPRIGGDAAFIHLHGMEGFSGMQVIEIPARSSLERQQHLYEHYIIGVSGRGATDVWQDDASRKVSFEWQEGSFFAIPMNSRYVMHNTSSEPALYLAVNNAPMIMDLFHREDFIFDNQFIFDDRFQPSADYYSNTERYENYFGGIAETNFIADINAIQLDTFEGKGRGVDATVFEMAGNTVSSHITTWPVGRYHKAHHHLGGAVLYGLQSTGYVLIWPQEAGYRPYEAGNEDRIVRMEWGPYSVYSPPSKWFHQHFNTGAVEARQLAFRGGVKHPTGIRRAGNPIIGGRPGVLVSTQLGGSLLDYSDEDPRIKADFVEALGRDGIASDMPDDLYLATNEGH